MVSVQISTGCTIFLYQPVPKLKFKFTKPINSQTELTLRVQFGAEEVPWLTMKAVTKFFTQHFAAAMNDAVDHHLKAHGLEGHEGQARAIESILEASDASNNAALQMAGAQGSLALQSPDMQALIGVVTTISTQVGTQADSLSALTTFAKTTSTQVGIFLSFFSAEGCGAMP